MFSIDKLLIIIVLYKEKLTDSAPFKSISKTSGHEKVSWFVYDNSPLPDNEMINFPSVTYIHDKENPGVSTAYNKGADYAKIVGKEWLLLFDQDTELSDDFLTLLQNEISIGPLSELYATRLLKGNALISPCGYKFKRGYILKGIKNGKNSLDNISFLNSGLIISVDLFFKAGGYDNSVPLYFSDFVFVNRIRKVYREFTLLPITLAHDLSSNDMSDTNAFKVRYDFYLKGTRESIQSEKSGTTFYYLSAFLRAVKLTLSLKDYYYLQKYCSYLLGRRNDHI